MAKNTNGKLGNFALKNKPETAVFTWHQPSLPNKKWAGKAFISSETEARNLNRLEMHSWPRESHVISGKKK